MTALKWISVFALSLCLVLVSFTARAAGPFAKRFQAIAARNLFGLKPLPPNVAKPPPAAPLPTITLAGMTTITGQKLALLKWKFPAQPTKEESGILKEGQRAGPIEVLEIDLEAETVKVRNSGTVMVLDFEKNGPKLPTHAPPPAPARRNRPRFAKRTLR